MSSRWSVNQDWTSECLPTYFLFCMNWYMCYAIIYHVLLCVCANRMCKVQCQGHGVMTPLVLSANSLCFPPTCIGSTSKALFTVTNPQLSRLHSAVIRGTAPAQGIRAFSFSLPPHSSLSLSPHVGLLNPGEVRMLHTNAPFFSYLGSNSLSCGSLDTFNIMLCLCAQSVGVEACFSPRVTDDLVEQEVARLLAEGGIDKSVGAPGSASPSDKLKKKRGSLHGVVFANGMAPHGRKGSKLTGSSPGPQLKQQQMHHSSSPVGVARKRYLHSKKPLPSPTGALHTPGYVCLNVCIA